MDYSKTFINPPTDKSQEKPQSQLNFLDPIELDRQLILDVCEPYIEKEPMLNLGDERSNLYLFGKLELGCDQYFYGSSEADYNNSDSDEVPIIFAVKEGEIFRQVAIWNIFASSMIEHIRDTMKYALESKKVATKYSSARC